MALFSKPPPPESGLARYRKLSPTAGVHVSPIVLGGMSIGDKWEELGMGTMGKESSFKLLDAYYNKGGNFIDTANFYQDGSSERFIGEWAEQRGIRDRLFISTKYAINTRLREPLTSPVQRIMFAGNNTKSLHISVKESLVNLRTDYIDLLYVHMWIWDASVPEVMRSLHKLVMQGKVLYLGASDMPAWIVSKANQYANDHALTPFVIYQGLWNVMDRSIEREIVPMAREEGMALAVWNVLAGGKLRTDEEEKKRAESGEAGRVLGNGEDETAVNDWKRNEPQRKMSQALEKVAKEVGARSITAVAIAYVMQKAPYVFPVVGGRKVEQLEDNISALDIALTNEHIEYLEGIFPFDLGFPCNFIGTGASQTVNIMSNGLIDDVPLVQPIRPVGRSG